MLQGHSKIVKLQHGAQAIEDRSALAAQRCGLEASNLTASITDRISYRKADSHSAGQKLPPPLIETKSS